MEGRLRPVGVGKGIPTTGGRSARDARRELKRSVQQCMCLKDQSNASGNPTGINPHAFDQGMPSFLQC